METQSIYYMAFSAPRMKIRRGLLSILHGVIVTRSFSSRGCLCVDLDFEMYILETIIYNLTTF